MDLTKHVKFQAPSWFFFLGPRFHSVCAAYPGTFHSLLPQRSSLKAPLCGEMPCVTKQTKGVFLWEHPVFSALVLPAKKNRLWNRAEKKFATTKNTSAARRLPVSKLVCYKFLLKFNRSYSIRIRKFDRERNQENSHFRQTLNCI